MPAPHPPAERIILGIDPGTNITGYGVLTAKGSKLTLITLGVIKLGRSKLEHPAKLKLIFQGISELLKQHLPDEVAIEAPFFGKDVQAMLKLGRVQGVAMAAAMLRDVPVAEYAPRKVKKAVTGRGTASKSQVASMLQHLLPQLSQHDNKDLLDASDGLAVAVCHALNAGAGATASNKRASKKGSWENFLSHNPDRLKGGTT